MAYKFSGVILMKKIIYLLVIFLSFNLYAKHSPKVVSGKVIVDNKKDLLNILQKTDKAILNWDDFSIKADEIFNFILPSNNAAILNKVVTSNPSLIYGQLNSNGKVFLVNPNGIIVGKNAVLNTNKFVASTLDVSNDEFLNGDDLHFTSKNFSKIENHGTINSRDDIFIIAQDIENKGSIKSDKSVNLIGASDVLLMEKTSKAAVLKSGEGWVSNEGKISAAKVLVEAAGGNIYSLAINQDGIIDTKGVYLKDGKVILSAKEGVISQSGRITSDEIHIIADHIHIENTSNISVSSEADAGSIFIGKTLGQTAKHVYIHEDANIYADSYTGNGGKVIVWSDDQTVFKGNISCQSLQNGNGGFVEISSEDKIIFEGLVDLRSVNGNIGLLAFDPGSVLIKHSDDEECSITCFSDSYINEQLKKANIEISTVDSNLNDDETITINSDVNIYWEEDTTFALRANKNIIIKENAQITNTSDQEFVAIDFKTTGCEGYFSGMVLEDHAKIATKSADIVLEGCSGNIDNNNYGLHLQGIIEASDESKAGLIKLIGKTKKADNDNSAIFLDGAHIISKNGAVYLDGISNASQENNHGIYLDNRAQIYLDNSELQVHAKGSGTNSSGIYFADAALIGNNSNISITAYEAKAPAVYISSDTHIYSDQNIDFECSNSFFCFGKVEAKENVNIDVGMNDDGRLVLKKTIKAKTLNIQGGKNSDLFYIDCSQSCLIDGSSKNNTLIAKDLANIFEITNRNQGIVNNEIQFQNIQNLKGSLYSDDIFILQKEAFLDGIADAQGGTNTLYSAAKDNVWHITGLNRGFIEGSINFNNIQNLIGSDYADEFIFSNFAEVNGIINGKSGYNKVDFSAYTNPITIDLHKILNIKEIIGGKNQDTLIGPEAQNIWKITGANEGYLGNIKFKDIDVLIGSDFTDKFLVEQNGSIGFIDGSKGYNYLFAPDIDNTWCIIGENEGYIENILHFANIHNLYGGMKKDIFTFLENAKIEGTIDGRSTNNIIDYSYFNKPATIDLKMMDNIQNIIGNEKSTLIAKDIDNIWKIDDVNKGILNENISFSNISNITSGAKSDFFEIEKNAHLDGKIDGFKGDNTLFAKTDDNTWNILAINAGRLNHKIQFENIQNLIGFDGSDCFIFENEGYITGNIDGKGSSNILDFSKQNTSMTIDLRKIDNVQTIIGGSAQDTLIAKDKNNIWQIAGEDTGKLSDIAFSNIENLIGGQLSDVFVFQDDSKITGFIDGGNDKHNMNILDFSKCTDAIEANVLAGSVSNIGHVSNMQAVVLPNIKPVDMTSQMPDFIEIPMFENDPVYDISGPVFTNLLNSNIKITDSSIDFDKLNLPLYISKNDEKTVVYRAQSPFVITYNYSKKLNTKTNMSPLLSEIYIADGSVRMRNNLQTAVKNKNIVMKGQLDKVDAVFEQDEKGFDLENYKVKPLNIKDRSIKTRPRSLHYSPKRNKINK